MEQKVEGEANDEYNEPPVQSKGAHEVLMSYPSNRANHVKQIKTYLEQNGFVCWMDVDDIDEGSSFSAQDKIDQAIRSSKAMVACFDQEYSSNDDDIAEVSLATYLGKRIVSIDLEPNNWSDSKMIELMNPLDDHISFYTSEEYVAVNGYFWPTASFEELVRRLREPYPVLSRQEIKPVQQKSQPAIEELPPAPPENPEPTVEPEPEPVPPPTPPPTIRPAEYHIITSCSPENLFDIKNLEKHFKYMGYRSKIMPLSDKRNFKLQPFDCNVLVCVLSPAYQRSKEAVQIAQTAIGMEADIIPLRMQRERTYPPKLMTGILDNFEPIDVSKHEPTTEWDHTKELDEIKARLRVLIPVVEAHQQLKDAKLPEGIIPKKQPTKERSLQPRKSRQSSSRSRRRQERESSARTASPLSHISKSEKDEPRGLISPIVFSDDEQGKKKTGNDDWSDKDEDSWGDDSKQKPKRPAAKYAPPLEPNVTVAYSKPIAAPEPPPKPRTPVQQQELPARSRTGASSSRSRRSAAQSSDRQMLKSQYRKTHENNY